MIIDYDINNLKKRQKTDFLIDGKAEYWAIYDFSYKYRTRIFNSVSEEVAYVEKDIYTEDKVNLFDHKGNRIDEIIKTSEGYRSDNYLYSGDIDKGEIRDLFLNDEGKITVNDENNALLAIMFIAGLVEISRKD